MPYPLQITILLMSTYVNLVSVQIYAQELV